MKEKINSLMKNGTKMRFSLRKLSIGVCSVILGLTFIESTTQNVDADTNVQSDATEQVKSVSLATSTTNSENNQAKDQESSIDQDKQNSQSTDSDESRSLVDEKSNNLDESTLKNDTGQEKSYFDETAKNGSLNQERVEQTSTTDNSSELSAKLEKNNANQDSQVLNTESVKVKTTYNKGVTQSSLYATMLYATSYSDNPWHYNGDTWSYSKGDGTQANTEWVIAPDGKWYYFDEDGEMAHDGWEDTRLHDGSWVKYYFDSNGHYDVNTWHYNGDTWSYSKGDGTQANTEWVVAPDGKWYYFDEDGEMAHDGWEDTRLHDGSWVKYYFDSNGHYDVNTWHYNGDTWSYSKGDGTQANTEWVVAPDGKWYYFDEDGEMAHDGWEDTRLHDGSWVKYYFDSNGHYDVNTWHYNGDTWSYSKGDGTQANTEWVVAPDGKWYYFDEDGEMAHDGWEDTRLHDGSWVKYYFDSNGHYNNTNNSGNQPQSVNSPWHYDGTNWTYSKGDGRQASDEWVIAPDGQWYYFESDGEMAHDGWVDTNCKDGWYSYYFDHNGHYAVSAWHQDTDGTWTYSKGDGRQASDEWVIAPDGQWYYFESDGEMAHDGWVDTNCKDGWYSYYFDHNGHYAVSAWHQDTDGTWTYSKGDGRQASDEWVIAPDGQWYYFESDGEMAHDGWVDTRLHDGSWDKYYFDSNGHYAVNAKRKALIDAQNALSELKGKIKGNELAVGGASGFFKEIAENPNMSEDQKNDARVAYAIVNGELDAPSWYDKDVNLGQSNDATSVKNFYATLPYYDQYVKIRQKYNLSVPKVSLADVAVAMMDADYSTHVVDHARHYNTSENLAWNCADDPNGIWMGEESIWNKAVKKNPSLAQYKNDGYGLYQADSELFEQVGHYLNLIDPSTSSYGYALNTESNDYDNTESWDSGYGDPVFSVDEFKKLVTDYYNKMELPDQVKAAQAKVNKAKKDLA